MFRTNNLQELQTLVDTFHVPVFAAEKAPEETQFSLICINEALGDISGLAPRLLPCTTLNNLLPLSEANAFEAHCQTCANEKSQLRYEEQMTLPGGTIHLDTTLQYV